MRLQVLLSTSFLIAEVISSPPKLSYCVPKPAGKDAYKAISLPRGQKWCEDDTSDTYKYSQWQEKPKYAYAGEEEDATNDADEPQIPDLRRSVPISVRQDTNASDPTSGVQVSNKESAQELASDVLPGQPAAGAGKPTVRVGSLPLGHSQVGANGAIAGFPKGKGTLPPLHGDPMQVTVTFYGPNCGTGDNACGGLIGNPVAAPTAAMGINWIPENSQGLCGTCWRVFDARELLYSAKSLVPQVTRTPFAGSEAVGAKYFVVLINNSCTPGSDQYGPRAVGQCAEKGNTPKDTDKLGSRSVLDLCEDTDGPDWFFGNDKGMAVASIVRTSCTEWTGTAHLGSS